MSAESLLYDPQDREEISFRECGIVASQLIDSGIDKLAKREEFVQSLVKGYFAFKPGLVGGLESSEIQYEQGDGALVKASYQITHNSHREMDGDKRYRSLQLMVENGEMREECVLEVKYLLSRRDDQSQELKLNGGHISHEGSSPRELNNKAAIERVKKFIEKL